jgi:hypothetical protein
MRTTCLPTGWAFQPVDSKRSNVEDAPLIGNPVFLPTTKCNRKKRPFSDGSTGGGKRIKDRQKNAPQLKTKDAVDHDSQQRNEGKDQRVFGQGLPIFALKIAKYGAGGRGDGFNHGRWSLPLECAENVVAVALIKTRLAIFVAESRDNVNTK